MINLFVKGKDCCGCTACKSICPVKAISIKPDDEGFLYPAIDQNLCTSCALCQKVCPLKNDTKSNDTFDDPLVYAVKHKSDHVRMSSTSGGMYTAISDLVLENHGVIYGAEFDENFYVHHTKATTASERDSFKGSKYIQSDLKNVFVEVNDELKNGKFVLFSGTGCQVAGLKNYLSMIKTNTEKLVLNDIICHGTPSPLLWKDYLKFIQKKSRLKSYTFRYKERGWHEYNIKAEFTNGKSKINTSDIKTYANIFGSDLALRSSCYNCKFASMHRNSDIMIGDYWGIEKSFPEMDDDRGVSLVFVNTLKGETIFDKIKDKIDFVKSNTKDCLQPNLQKPTKMPMNRKQFWNDYEKYGFNYIARKYAGYNFKGRLKKTTIDLLKKLGLFEMIRKALR